MAYEESPCVWQLGDHESGITFNMADDFVCFNAGSEGQERRKKEHSACQICTDVSWHKLGSASDKYNKGQYWCFCMFYR